MKIKLTLSLPEEFVERLKIAAVRRKVSVGRLLMEAALPVLEASERQAQAPPAE